MPQHEKQIDVWIHHTSKISSASRNRIADTLRSVGIGAVAPKLDKVEGTGVLLISRADSECCEAVRRLARSGSNRVLVIAVPGCVLDGKDTWNIMKEGATDVISWDRFDDVGRAVSARLKRWRTVDRLVTSGTVRNDLVGESRCWRELLRRVVQVAHFTSNPILLTGESGTGKELLARLIHRLDRRAEKGDFVIVDCTTIAPELSGSEFFGHERGSFTGAISSRDGAFALADGGTLFLDEVGELPTRLQAELLRVIERQTYKRIGSNIWKRTAFRLVCATNRDLSRAQSEGCFRRDLYFRIAGDTFSLPPLRQRVQDILPLARHFIRQTSPAGDSPPLDGAVSEWLVSREYPGNVRDLRQLILRMMARYVGQGPITVGCIPHDDRRVADLGEANWSDGSFAAAILTAVFQRVGLKVIGKTAADIAVQLAIDNANGDLQGAAKLLRVTPRALQLRVAATRRDSNAPFRESAPADRQQ